MSAYDDIVRARARRAELLATACGALETPLPTAGEVEAAAEAHHEAPSTHGAPLLDFQRFRARRIRAEIRGLLETLVAAVERRDLQGVWDVLDEAAAMRCFPPAVREEALVLARAPKASLRAPIRLYQFYEQLRRLDDEPLEWGDPDQLDLALSARGADIGSRRSISSAGAQRVQAPDPTWSD